MKKIFSVFIIMCQGLLILAVLAFALVLCYADSPTTGSYNTSSNATTAIGPQSTIIRKIVVNTVGTTSTVALYNIGSAGCSGTPASGYVATVATTSAGVIEINHLFTLGACVVTAGGAAANVTVLYSNGNN